MKATNDFELAKRFREILEIPERVNDMTFVETKEMLLYCFKNKKYGISREKFEEISVINNLLVYFNQKYQKKKLPIYVITNDHFHTVMELLLHLRWEPERVAEIFEETLNNWENNDTEEDSEKQVIEGDDSEKQVIKQIVQFLNDYEEIWMMNSSLIPAQSEDQTMQEKDKDSNTVDDILNEMFNLPKPELENLKLNLLNNGRQYVSLTYIGLKTKLWKDLAKLLSAGVDRKEIARVFSKYCKWQKSIASQSINLESDEIYRKIDKKGIKKG